MKEYEEAKQYILGIPRFAGKNMPGDTGRLLLLLTGRKSKSKIIHIAGTNGKGSVCAYLRSILMSAGRSVGTFTSPHLETIRERICLENEMISEEDFTAAYKAVKKAADQGKEQGLGHPSFFEFLFLMAMLYFDKREPDYIILETGLGGRLDATNCIERPKLCIITEIGYDHMEYLGNTLEEIAAEKAGIIKEEIPVVFVDRRREVTGILTKYAKEKRSLPVILKKDNILNVNINNKTIDFSLHTGYYNYVSLFLDTAALYQVENASLAVLAAETLQDEKIAPEVIRQGLSTAYWPGRMEEAVPGIYLDGAHNEDGIEAFLETIASDGCEIGRLLLFGVVSDKDYRQMIGRIVESGFFKAAAVTALETERSAAMDRLKQAWGEYERIPCSFHRKAEDAFQALLAKRRNGERIYIVGSLYLIGQMKALMRRIQND